LTGISINLVTQYIKEYKVGGTEKLKDLNFYRLEEVKMRWKTEGENGLFY